MVAAIGMGTAGHRIAVARTLMGWGQGMVGCMIARSFSASASMDLLQRWPVFLSGVLAVIAASTLLGWWMMRMRFLPGSTAVWGMSPGAASAMTLMSANYGADARLVALMQYLRVLLVAGVASIVAHVLGEHSVGTAAVFPLDRPVHWEFLAATVVIALSGHVVARLARWPSAALVFPMFAAISLQRMGIMEIELTYWVLALAFAVIGWSIGLKFNRDLLLHAARSLPRIVACTSALIAVCAAFAALLVMAAGVDPMTAYLAMSPGGIDSVAIIAVSNRIDEPFVMTMQVLRLVTVVLLGPMTARFAARNATR